MGAGGTTSDPKTPEEERERENFMNSLRKDYRTSSYFFEDLLKKNENKTTDLA